MKGNFKATSALALLSDKSVATENLQKFGDRVADEFAQIPQQEQMNAARAILVGIGLHAVKAGMKHGEFTPWLQSKVNQVNFWSPATAKVNASYYMRLAIAFVEQSKPTRPEMLAITAATEPLNLKEAAGHAAKLLERVKKFIGERSLNEILIEEGIKNGGAGGGSSSKAAIGGGEDPLLADTATHLMGLRDLILNPDTVKRYTASQLNDIEVQLASALDQFRKLKAALRA
jgi:Protein of unknown function (DUF3102)